MTDIKSEQTSHLRWCLTINNYVANDLQVFFDKPFDKYRYYVIGFELSEDGRTPHLQCYLEFKESKTFKELKGLYPRAHIEVAKKSHIENTSYCMKSGAHLIYGVPLTN